MSKLTTTIPIDIQTVLDAIKAVPKSTVHSVELKEDMSGVEVIWDCHDIKTPYTFPVDYPLEKLNVSDKVVDKPEKRRRSVT